MSKKRTSIYINHKILLEVEALAKRLDRSKSWVIEQAAKSLLEQTEAERQVAQQGVQVAR